jgi:hypothetical protein
MASVTEVKLVDDLDGGKADESITFALDGRSFEIDLSEKHARKLRDGLAPFINAARRAGGGSAAARPKSVARAARPREDTAAIREWANANGHAVSARGRISSAVRTAYEARGNAAPVAAAEIEAPAVEAEAKPKRRTRKKVADPFKGDATS